MLIDNTHNAGFSRAFGQSNPNFGFKNCVKYGSQPTKFRLFINLRLETGKFILTRTIVATNYLSALTSEYVNAPADSNNVIINPTKIISI
jgi:hypothetical protein